MMDRIRTVLPVISRELTVSARQPGTYRMRSIAGLLGAATSVFVLLKLTERGVPPAAQGRQLFMGLVVVASILCAFAGAHATSDAISRERREDTLGLLFLTDLRSVDLLLGKLVARGLHAAYGLVAVTPLLCFPLQLGGVTAGDYARAACFLGGLLLTSLVAGLYVSSRSINERKALFGTVLVMLLVIFGPVFLLMWFESMGFLRDRTAFALAALSPLGALGFLLLNATGVGGMGINPVTFFWLSYVILLGYAALLLLRAARRLRGGWRSNAGQSGSGWASSKADAIRARLGPVAEAMHTRSGVGRAALETNAYLWMTIREPWRRHAGWILVGSMIVIWAVSWLFQGSLVLEAPVTVPFSLMVGWVLKVWVVAEISQRIVDDRRTSAMELILTTPLGVRGMLGGMAQGLKRQLLVPFGLWVLFDGLLLSRSVAPGMVVGMAGCLVADCLGLALVTVWMSARGRTLSRCLLGGLFVGWWARWPVFGLVTLVAGGVRKVYGRPDLDLQDLAAIYMVLTFAHVGAIGAWWVVRSAGGRLHDALSTAPSPA